MKLVFTMTTERLACPLFTLLGPFPLAAGKCGQKSPSNPTRLCDSFPGRVGFPHSAAEEGSGDPDLLGPSLTPYLVFASALASEFMGFF